MENALDIRFDAAEAIAGPAQIDLSPPGRGEGHTGLN
jgi:hypothetical protein